MNQYIKAVYYHSTQSLYQYTAHSFQLTPLPAYELAQVAVSTQDGITPPRKCITYISSKLYHKNTRSLKHGYRPANVSQSPRLGFNASTQQMYISLHADVYRLHAADVYQSPYSKMGRSLSASRSRSHAGCLQSNSISVFNICIILISSTGSSTQ